jgi:pimeloyl-ACP methyl ester carboxylesterase
MHANPPDPTGKPPILFVPGFGYGAWQYSEHWSERAAARGFPTTVMDFRPPVGKVSLRTHTHDVTQVAAALPRQAILIGHGAGALIVGHAMARYPVRAAVLVAPVFGGLRSLAAALSVNVAGTLPAAFGARLRFSRRQLFSPATPVPTARAHLARMGRVSAGSQWQLLRGRAPEAPVGSPPVLTVGSPDDKVAPRAMVTAIAGRYGGAPLEFPGMGHSLMLEPGWAEPIDAILDWLDKQVA